MSRCCLASVRSGTWLLVLALGCGARSGLDPSELELATGGIPNGGAAPTPGGSSGSATTGGISTAGTASGGSMAMGGIATGGVAGSPDAGAAGAGGAAGAPPEPRAVQAVAGAFHSCVRFDDGSVRCWGHALHAGLALGASDTIGDDEPASSVPDVNVGGAVVQLAASWYHTCAVLDSGALRCWGNNGGRLGYGYIDDIGDDETPAAAGDVPVGGKVLQVATGPEHTCAVLDGGGVRCWGDNTRYQLGYPLASIIGDDEWPSSVPLVDVGGPVKQVACGFSHTCALLESGKVRCWGTGGPLGYGSLETIGDDETPATAGDIELGGVATQITVGVSQTCALLENGAIRCWGRGYNGVLGYGNTNAIGDDETPASAGDVDTGGPVKLVSVGDHATCALIAGGVVRCWGEGQLGELGQKSTDSLGDDEAPSSVGAVELGGIVTQLDVGFLHVCAVMQSGGVRCWGRAGTGALGYGDVEDIGDDEYPEQAGEVPLR